MKEQKALLMASESGDSATIQHNVMEVLNVCTLSGNLDLDTTPIIDIEYYFLMLRAKSVGEIVESKYRCNNIVDDKECNNIMKTSVNLTEIKPVTDEIVDPEIQLTDTIIVKMKYPEFSVVKDSVNIDSLADITFNLIASSIEYIYDGEQFHYAKESQPAELIEFVEGLSQKQFEKMEHFFNNMPKLKQNVQMKCSKCGYDHSFDVEGLESFFG